MDRIVSAIGIALVAFGTVLSVLSVLFTKADYVGTADELDNRGKSFKKQKLQVVIGIVFIIMGSICQIVGLFV